MSQNQVHTLISLFKKAEKQFSLSSLLKHIDHHIEDIHFASQYIQASTLLELGSGVGLNVLLLGIFKPTLRISAIEKNTKKLGWSQLQAKALSLPHLSFYLSLEEFTRTSPHTSYTLFLKAFTPLNTLPAIINTHQSSIDSIFVIEGQKKGISTALAQTKFQEKSRLTMPHGHCRYFVILTNTLLRNKTSATIELP